MNRLPLATRAHILSLLCNAVSLRATANLTGVSFNSVLRFNVSMGKAAETYADQIFQNLTLSDFECDEIWQFVSARDANIPDDESPDTGRGHTYAWIAINPETRLVPCWHVGSRGDEDAKWFIDRLHQTLKPDGRKITFATDGWVPYIGAIESAFGSRATHTRCIKDFHDEEITEARRGAPQRLIGMRHYIRDQVIHDSDATTNYIESLNNTIRTNLKRFARESNAHSKSFENHRLGLSMMLMAYNFVRYHSVIRCSPAMQAGLAKNLWSWEDMARLTDLPMENEQAA